MTNDPHYLYLRVEFLLGDAKPKLKYLLKQEHMDEELLAFLRKFNGEDIGNHPKTVWLLSAMDCLNRGVFSDRVVEIPRKVGMETAKRLHRNLVAFEVYGKIKPDEYDEALHVKIVL